MQQVLSRLKPFLRWLILGGTLFFLGKVLKDNWENVLAIRINQAGLASLATGLGITLFAHICAGWVWSRILRDFKQPVNGIWIIQAYLKTNIAKYLPGNVWHYYGRINAATKAGASLGAATVSVLLEPLLMAASALLVAILCSQQIGARYGLPVLALQWLSLAVILASIHPMILNPLMRVLSKLKQKKSEGKKDAPFKLEKYPLSPLIGELSFLVLRGVGFLFTFLAVSPVMLDDLPLLISAFCFAWLLGLVVPGAPGGVGVFEATAIALLGRSYDPGIILSVVALYRLISTLAEAGGAGLAWLDEQRTGYTPLVVKKPQARRAQS